MGLYHHDVNRTILTFATDLGRLASWLVLLLVVFVPLERTFGRGTQKVTSFTISSTASCRNCC